MVLGVIFFEKERVNWKEKYVWRAIFFTSRMYGFLDTLLMPAGYTVIGRGIQSRPFW